MLSRRQLYEFDSVINALKEKYLFTFEESKERIEKASGNCTIDLLIREKIWKISSPPDISATYIEQKIFDPITQVELGNKDIDGDFCHDFPYQALQINHIETRKKIDALVQEILKTRELQEKYEYENELNEL